MQTCDPLEHPAAHVRRNNIVRLARLGGGDTQLQQLARVARGDADAGCRAAAVAAMVAISPEGDRCPHAVIAVVNECLRDPDAAVRNAAARALGLDRSRADDAGTGLGPGGAYSWGRIPATDAQTRDQAGGDTAGCTFGDIDEQHERQKQDSDMDWTAQAAMERIKGNRAHEQGNHKEARTRYLAALEILDRVDQVPVVGDAEGLKLVEGAGVDREAREMRVACLQNVAAACLKLGRFEECVDFCCDAIGLSQAEGVGDVAGLKGVRLGKAFYRRALAHSELGHWRTALSDVERAHSLVPGDPKVEALRQRALAMCPAALVGGETALPACKEIGPSAASGAWPERFRSAPGRGDGGSKAGMGQEEQGSPSYTWGPVTDLVDREAQARTRQREREVRREETDGGKTDLDHARGSGLGFGGAKGGNKENQTGAADKASTAEVRNTWRRPENTMRQEPSREVDALSATLSSPPRQDSDQGLVQDDSNDVVCERAAHANGDEEDMTAAAYETESADAVWEASFVPPWASSAGSDGGADTPAHCAYWGPDPPAAPFPSCVSPSSTSAPLGVGQAMVSIPEEGGVDVVPRAVGAVDELEPEGEALKTEEDQMGGEAGTEVVQDANAGADELSMDDLAEELKRFRAEFQRAPELAGGSGEGKAAKGYREPTLNRRSPAIVSAGVTTPGRGRGWDGLQVLAAGLNNYGQLGLGHVCQVSEKGCTEDAGVVGGRSAVDACGIAFKMVACGETHSVAVVNSKDGGDTVVAVGANDCGQLGHGDGEDRSVWAEVLCGNGPGGRGGLPPGVGVKALACGQSHSLILLHTDEVLGWGDNTHGQLGLCPPRSSSFLSAGSATAFREDGTVEYVPVPTKIVGLCGRRAVMLCGGGGHTVLLSESADVWSMGLNSRGQLGLSLGDEHTYAPRLLSWRPGGEAGGEEVRVVNVACGTYHTVFLAGDGSMHACGDNSRGQCGLGPLSHQPNPTRLLLPAAKDAGRGYGQQEMGRVIQVACGRRHTVGLTEDRVVIVTGDNRQGQLGLGHSDTVSTLQRNGRMSSVRVDAVFCGGDASFFSKDEEDFGMAWGCGYNEDGMLTLLEEDLRLLPARILRGRNVQALACGYYHAFFGVASLPASSSVVGEEAACEQRPVGVRCREENIEDAGEAGGGGSARIHAGATVKIVGLTDHQDLNGKMGTVVKMTTSPKDGQPRACVRIGDGEFGVRPANLALV